jgi:flagellar motor protein MotB
MNKILSDQRAKNVAKFFTEVGGIDGNRIQAKGFGQEKPVASNASAEGRALNRRVEILIVNDGR